MREGGRERERGRKGESVREREGDRERKRGKEGERECYGSRDRADVSFVCVTRGSREADDVVTRYHRHGWFCRGCLGLRGPEASGQSGCGGGGDLMGVPPQRDTPLRGRREGEVLVSGPGGLLSDRSSGEFLQDPFYMCCLPGEYRVGEERGRSRGV